MQNNPAYYKIQAPSKLESRLITEDVPTGILPMVELGKISGVPTPLLKSVLHISEALLERDFNVDGRTLKNLYYDIDDLNAIKEKLQS